MRRRKDVANRSVSITYQLRHHDDVSAWSTTSRPIWGLNETSLRRRMPGGIKCFTRNILSAAVSCWKQALPNSFWQICLESPVSLNFWILSLFFVNGQQALYVNLGCLKYISGINLSPANKNLINILFNLYPKTKRT